MWISLINMHASVKMVTQGKPVRLMWTSANRPPLMPRCVSMGPPASTAKDQTLHAGESVYCKMSSVVLM